MAAPVPGPPPLLVPLVSQAHPGSTAATEADLVAAEQELDQLLELLATGGGGGNSSSGNSGGGVYSYP